MKIGILTQPLGSNYGGILQNWALQQVLSKMGHNPITIKHYGFSRCQQFLTDLRCIGAWVVKQIIRHRTRNVYVLPWQRQRGINKRLTKFVKKHIAMTALISPLTEMNVMKQGLNAIVVGSDQTWRPMYNQGHLSEMFCNFLSDSCAITRIAYASSFGVDNWEYNEAQTEMAKNAVSKFKAVTVRELSGVNLCKKHLEVDALHVLDPTLLLEPKDYNRLISQKVLDEVPEKCVGVYILDETEEKIKFVEQVCKILGKNANWFGRKDESEKYPSVEHWLASFEKSDFIITDSFHGTAFAINYHRPFLSIVNSARGADRFVSLLSLFGLENRIIDTDSKIINTLIDERIDWCSFEEMKNRERDKSFAFLDEVC